MDNDALINEVVELINEIVELEKILNEKKVELACIFASDDN